MLEFFAFLGGLALFLYGMELMGDGLQQLAGARLQKILGSLTGHAAMGVAMGTLVTALLQSSTATTVMAVGFVNAGLMTLKQAFSVVMGANIGTTVTAQLIAFRLTDYMTLMLFIGLMFHIFARRKRGRFFGQALLGFGMLMLGMGMMQNAVMPLRTYPGISDFIARFADNPFLGVVVGIIMTLLIQSSAATIGILMAMASQGLIPLEGAVPVLFGDNIGTCLTAILAASRQGVPARQVALSHVIFNAAGCVIFLCLMPLFIKIVVFISPAGDIARQIANAHSAFNVLNTMLFFPFITPFVHLVEKILPDKSDKISMKPLYLDDNMTGTPAVALALARRETDRMADLAKENLATALSAIREYDPKKVEEVLEKEPVVDALNESITVYLTHISEKGLSAELSAVHTGLLHACTDLERIGDHAQTLAKRARKIYEEEIEFSQDAEVELAQLGDLTLEACSACLESLSRNDRDMAQKAWEKCREVKTLAKELRRSHAQRLGRGECVPDKAFVFLEVVLNMKRVSDHSKNLAQLVLGIF